MYHFIDKKIISLFLQKEDSSAEVEEYMKKYSDKLRMIFSDEAKGYLEKKGKTEEEINKFLEELSNGEIGNIIEGLEDDFFQAVNLKQNDLNKQIYDYYRPRLGPEQKAQINEYLKTVEQGLNKDLEEGRKEYMEMFEGVEGKDSSDSKEVEPKNNSVDVKKEEVSPVKKEESAPKLADHSESKEDSDKNLEMVVSKDPKEDQKSEEKKSDASVESSTKETTKIIDRDVVATFMGKEKGDPEVGDYLSRYVKKLTMLYEGIASKFVEGQDVGSLIAEIGGIENRGRALEHSLFGPILREQEKLNAQIYEYLGQSVSDDIKGKVDSYLVNNPDEEQKDFEKQRSSVLKILKKLIKSGLKDKVGTDSEPKEQSKEISENNFTQGSMEKVEDVNYKILDKQAISLLLGVPVGAPEVSEYYDKYMVRVKDIYSRWLAGYMKVAEIEIAGMTQKVTNTNQMKVEEFKGIDKVREEVSKFTMEVLNYYKGRMEMSDYSNVEVHLDGIDIGVKRSIEKDILLAVLSSMTR